MKRGLPIALFVLAVLCLVNVSASCSLNASMINQDPYPAVPGDYVKVVFQVEGVENPDCGDIFFELIQDYPISLDPATASKISISGGTFTNDYNSFLMVPYKVRIDGDALDGPNPIKVKFSTVGKDSISLIKQFNIEVKQVKTSFEVHVKSYDPTTNSFTLEVLNIGKNDVEAVTLEIPPQKEISLKGSRTNIIGNLDSNEYTTADFEAVPDNGNFKVNIKYTDSTGTRRETSNVAEFEQGLFEKRNGDSKGPSIWIYVIITAVLAYLGYKIYKKRKHKK